MFLSMENHREKDFPVTKVRDSYSETVMVDENLCSHNKAETLVSSKSDPAVEGGFGDGGGCHIYVDEGRGFVDRVSREDLKGEIACGDGGSIKVRSEKEIKESDDSGRSEVTGDSGVEESSLADESRVVTVRSASVKEAIGHCNGTNSLGASTCYNSEAQQCKSLRNKVQCRVMEATFQASSVVSNGSNLETQVEAPRWESSGAIDSGCGRYAVKTEIGTVPTSNFTSLDEQKHVVIERQVASLDNEGHSYSDIETMDTDAFNANFCFTVEELQDGPVAYADTQCSYQATPVLFGGELTTAESRLLHNSENVEEPKIKHCSERQVKEELVDGSAAGHWDACLDSKTSCVSTQSVVGNGAAHNGLSDPSFEVTDFVDFDMMLCSSGTDQLQYESMCRGIDADLQATSTTNHKQPNLAYEAVRLSTVLDGRLMRERKDAITNNDLKGPGEENGQVKAEGLAACDGIQTLSSRDKLQIKGSSSSKRKHDVEDCINPYKRERATNTSMVASWDSMGAQIVSDGKANNQMVRPSPMSVSATTQSSPNTSFKIGERISRVACQMTGPSPSQNFNGISNQIAGNGFGVSTQHSNSEILGLNIPPDVLLSQLHLASQDPMKAYGFLSNIIGFFSSFRNSVIVDQHDRVGVKQEKASHVIGDSHEMFQFDDLNDAYWTDRVIQNGSDEQPSHKSQRLPIASHKPHYMSGSRMHYSSASSNKSAAKPAGFVDDKAPAELVMHFPVVDTVPSEISLNKMFRRFGPLKEYETEIDWNTNRARVVFKRCSDAEAAYGSAPKFNIFGPVLVNYQLNYTLSIPFKTEQVVAMQGEEDATVLLQY